ncbi:hypothetical protein V2J09_011672 [Rumex salicifolius]
MLYTPGHHLKHKKSQIYFLECDDDEEDLSAETSPEAMTEQPSDIGEQLQISLNALSGSAHFNCMRVVGQVGQTKLHILIDPGSTHNFLNLDVAKLLGCRLEYVKPLLVAAVGHKLTSEFKCSDFAWRVQGYDFSTEVRTLPLDCCDLVLGIQWLTTVGPVWWDFVNMRMEFVIKGIKHVLRGVQPGCKIIKGSSLNRILNSNPQLALLQLCDPPTTESVELSAQFYHISASGCLPTDHPDIQQLLDDFADSNSSLKKLITELQEDKLSHPQFTFINNELRRHGKLVIGQDPSVKLHIFKWLHDSAVGGHSGRDATLKRVKSLFYWKGMNTKVQNYVRNYTICQRNKYDLSAKPGLLQPLPIPEGIWQSISLDFIEGLPASFNRHCILVVWWYNTTFHSAIQATPYEIVYGQSPPTHLPYLPGESKSKLVDRSLQKREKVEPESILERKMVKHHGAAATKVLVQWKGQSADEETWEFYADFAAKFPSFDP